MIKRKKTKVAETKFSRVYELELNGFTIVRGEVIKIQNEHGRKFKFDSVVTNTETGVQWIDCFEMYKMASGQQCSFRIDKVKRIPARRGRRKKSVN